ncbi:MAG: LysM peptidoglycan-binding domain-containing protein [bacterium]|nr:LysM peptidoglycan-binding domain-containing protein [bacterium]
MTILVFPGALSAAEWKTQTVRRGDNLTSLARQNQTTVANLRQWNGLTGDRIMVGQVLKVGQRPSDDAVYVVVRGDYLARIAARNGTTVKRLKKINDLKNDRIYIGQKLRLREAEFNTHIVERGDALWEIARAYGMTVAEIKRINNLKSDRILVGQELQLKGSAAELTAVYIVQRGDNLTEIARLHQMSLSELRRLNNLKKSVIHPDQKLKVRPIPGAISVHPSSGKPLAMDWNKLTVNIHGVQRLRPGNGPYYYEMPRAANQRNKTYREESSISPQVCYNHGVKLIKKFDQALDAMPALSHKLDGWHFVLDPGHGGIDPGAIVQTTDSAGKNTYIVEDEYAYDMSLRVYALLKLHGATVTLTMLSPNHLLRKNSPITKTFVHDRNEVFNDKKWNQRNRPSTWPKGGQKYLNQRVAISRRAFRNAPRNRQIFLSFHADNDPPSGEVVTLLYYHSGRDVDHTSRKFAEKLLPDMGAGAVAKGRSLGVLRNNPAKYKLLVEMRNLAFDDHIWAVRYEKLRNRDAEKVVQALLNGLALE